MRHRLVVAVLATVAVMGTAASAAALAGGPPAASGGDRHAAVENRSGEQPGDEVDEMTGGTVPPTRCPGWSGCD